MEHEQKPIEYSQTEHDKIEPKLISFKESIKKAEDLLLKYRDQIKKQMQKDIDGWGEPYTDYQKSIDHFLSEIPEDTLKHFQGHGITRNSELEQLAGALNILANKSIKGWCGQLVGETHGYGAYKHGDFLIVSKFDKKLPIYEKKDTEPQPITNEIGWLADIGAFVIDTKYYPIVEELKEEFPTVNIIKANEIEKYFKI